MKIILCGYYWTGCKALELLLQEGHDVFVYTHKTENYIVDLEGLCIKKHIAYTLEKITGDNLPFVPDIICSIYYRYLIKQDVIEIVKGRIFNLHPILLPKYYCCSSLTWTMIKGKEECGFTYQYIDESCGTGRVIIQKAIKIEDFDTRAMLYNRVMFESMDYFLEAVHLVKEGYDGKEQNGVAIQYKRDWLMEKNARGGKIVIYGCGGHARSIINVIFEMWKDIDIIMVDDNAKADESILTCSVEPEYALQEDDNYIIAIGDNNKREGLYQQLMREGRGHCISLFSLYSNIGLDTYIGRGTFVAANAYIGPQAKIGNDTIINTGSIVEHEVYVGDHTHIAPHATVCGRAWIGNNVFCGAGSTIIDNIHICDRVTIGAGAVVKEDITESGTYAGVPARKVG